MARIQCEECGRALGTMIPPDAAALKQMLAATHFAALAGMIPENATDGLAEMLRFRCLDEKHETRSDTDGSEKKDSDEGADREEELARTKEHVRNVARFGRVDVGRPSGDRSGDEGRGR